MKLKTNMLLVAAGIALAACASQPVATALAFGPFNSPMDQADKAKARQAVIENVPTRWTSAAGHDFTVTPTRTAEGASGLCRDYTITGNVNGKQEKFSSQACRRADGSWYSGG